MKRLICRDNDIFIRRITLAVTTAICLFIFLFPHAVASATDSVHEMAAEICSGGTQHFTEAVKGEGMYGELLSYATGVSMKKAGNSDLVLDYAEQTYSRRNPNATEEEIEKASKKALETYLFTEDNGAGSMKKAFEVLIKALKYVAAFVVAGLAIGKIAIDISKENDPFDAVLKGMMGFSITAAVILNIDKIVAALCWIGLYLADKASSAVTTSKAAGMSVDAFLMEVCGKTNFNFVSSIGATIQLFFPYIIAKIINLASTFLLIQTILDIGIRRLFVPFAITDIAYEGLRSPGVRYLKKLFASIIKITVCVVILGLSAKLGGVIAGSAKGMEYAWGVILINLSTLGLMFKGGEYANDIVGV